MVKVSVKRHNDMIQEFEISDHAGYADSGQDLVCAGVSSIAVGMMNALDKLEKDMCEFCMKQAYIKISVKKQSEGSNRLLEAMLIQLETMQQSYKQYINIRYQEV